jgi:hypothetical protein
MKRLASRLTWWHMLLHKSTPRSTPQKGEVSHGPYWHRLRRRPRPEPDTTAGFIRSHLTTGEVPFDRL